jgi:hypothetical protein
MIPLPTAKGQRCRWGYAMLVAAALAGCARTPQSVSPVSEEQRAGLRTIGIVAADRAPRFDFSPATKGRVEGAAKGAAAGAGSAAQALSGGSCHGEICGAVLILELGVVGVAAIVGGAVGALSAEDESTMAEVRGAVGKAFQELEVQREFGSAVQQYAVRHVRYRVVSVSTSSSPAFQPTPQYGVLSDLGIDAVLEVGVESIGTRGEGINPPLALEMTARARLVRVADHAVLADSRYRYVGEPRKYRDWAADEARPFRTEMQRAYTDLAKQIVDTMLSAPSRRSDAEHRARAMAVGVLPPQRSIPGGGRFSWMGSTLGSLQLPVTR